MSASGTGPGGDAASEAEVRAYLERLRGAPVEDVIAELASMLVTAAQVKLGRPDGRLLLDVLGAVTTALEGRIDPALTGQLAEALAQLRLAQVQAEGAAGGPTVPMDPVAPAAAGGTPSSASRPAPAAPPATGPGAGQGPSQRSRLWVPGG